MTFFEKLDTSVQKNNSLLCVGLDTDIHKIPKFLVEESEDHVFEFNKAIIDATHDLVCAYKPNSAYYEADGIEGLASLEKTIEYIHSIYPEIPVILDAKRADIGSTSEHYAMAAFDYFKADGLTLHPYMGEDSLEFFLKRPDKGCIILCRTSNPSASDFQDLLIEGKPLYIRVGEKVMEWDKKYHNCLMVVGATWPKQMEEIRALAPEMNFLVPGIGSQGGDLEGIMKTGLRPDKAGLIINSGRSIIYASSDEDFAEKAHLEAQKLRDEINKYR
jgi:orotidine-5'-phosphate decarboxylase